MKTDLMTVCAWRVPHFRQFDDRNPEMCAWRTLHTFMPERSGGATSGRQELDGELIEVPSLEECYLSWDDDGVVLVCERVECMIPTPMHRLLDGATPHHRFFTEEIPHHCLPEQAVLIRARHLATHTEES